MDAYTLLYLRWITDKGLPWSAGSTAQCYVAAWMGGGPGGECVCCVLVAQLCLTLCDPMNGSTPGFPVHHQLPESTQTHIHCVGDAIQPSHPLSSPSPPALNPSQRVVGGTGSFQMSQLSTSGGQSIGVSASTSVPPMNTQD